MAGTAAQRPPEGEALLAEIQRLARERGAVILAHNYQRPEVQDLADHVGDSLELSRLAAKAAEKVIVFCGVWFMAETAKILSPKKTVLIPDPKAGCPLADMCTPGQLAAFQAEHAGAVTVTYVNSSAEVKAMSDLCCTSANAAAVVRTVPEDREILFVPDRNLGRYVSEVTGRAMHLWDGFCVTHQRIRPEEVEAARAAHPGARVVVHPECTEEVTRLADEVASTSGILRYCRDSDAQTFIIGTENRMLHRLRKENPGKTFVPASPDADCMNMLLTTPEKVHRALRENKHEVVLDEEVRGRAARAVERMVEVLGD